MRRIELEGTAKVWLYDGPGGWHFATLPKAMAQDVRRVAARGPGWGSVRVEATIGKTTWSTSIFPDKASGSFVLPIKKDVRKAEGIADGDRVKFALSLAL